MVSLNALFEMSQPPSEPLLFACCLCCCAQ